MTAPSLTELLQTWQSWSYRDTLTRGAAQADAAGDVDRAERIRLVLAREPDVSPLDALAANYELTGLLLGWQWHAMRAARETGASWSDIGRAVGTTAEQARAGYLDHICRAEAHGAGLTPYRAVLDDPPRLADRPGAAGTGMGERPTASCGAVLPTGVQARGGHR